MKWPRHSHSATSNGTPCTRVTAGGSVAILSHRGSDASRFLNFTIAGLSATAPFASQATTSPASTSNPYEAIFQALTTFAQTNSSNASFTLDLLAFNNFTSGNALTVLTTLGIGNALETRANSFDGNYSLFSVSRGTGTATTQSLIAALNPASLSTSVPEPASLALLGAPMIGLVFRRH